METEWFEHSEWWFNCTPEIDLHISNKYEHLLDDLEIKHEFEYILRYDQLPRHVYRNKNAAHIIEFFLRKALNINIDIESIEDDHKFCFALLPLRHTNDFGLIYKAINLCWKRIQIKDSLILRKFLKASYSKCPLIGSIQHINTDPCNSNYNLIEWSGLPNSLNANPIIISISGGVDSMVLSNMLVTKYGKDRIYGLHINYANRDTSDSEMQFVLDWCRLIGIKCYVRRIGEIQRFLCMKYGLRDTYESYTRNVRYHCYKEFGNNALIALGHNKDDILENIFTNILYCTKYENLDGMTEFSIQDDIRFWRPLLNLSKDEIIKMANDYKIDHLPCSTPKWSMRGKIRNSIVPVLNEWNPKFIDSLHVLSSTVSELYTVLETAVNDCVNKSRKRKDYIVFYIETINTTYIFWRILFEKFGCYGVSTKSIMNLCDRLKKIDIAKRTTYVLNKNYTLVIDKQWFIYM